MLGSGYELLFAHLCQVHANYSGVRMKTVEPQGTSDQTQFPLTKANSFDI